MVCGFVACDLVVVVWLWFFSVTVLPGTLFLKWGYGGEKKRERR